MLNRLSHNDVYDQEGYNLRVGLILNRMPIFLSLEQDEIK